MTPVLDPPRRAKRSTESATVNLDRILVETIDEVAVEGDSMSWFDSNFWPEGIDYDKWAAVVRPSPRSAFADRLDIVDLTED
jgi:hypothetical protein